MKRIFFILFIATTALCAGAIAQITSNPIPTAITKRGLSVEIKDVVRFPDTRGMRPADQDVSPAGWARISYVRDLPDGRRFANDSRGFLHLLGTNSQPQVYANVAAAFPNAVYNRLESGFIGFVFHPEFARNGLFYTIPLANKFASDDDPKTLGEIYAYGFRNAHRLSWDADGTMFASDIGMNHVEEINIVRNGENYGWMKREGYWENGRSRGGALNELFPLPADVLSGRVKDGFTYPVAIYDHDEGQAVTDGFAYHGRIAALRGKFVFGDIQRGRLFAADLAEMRKADDGIPQTVAPIEEIQLYVRDASGNPTNVSLQELINRTMGATISRADLHISRTADGELLITSRQDGMIRMLVPDTRE